MSDDQRGLKLCPLLQLKHLNSPDLFVRERRKKSQTLLPCKKLLINFKPWMFSHYARSTFSFHRVTSFLSQKVTFGFLLSPLLIWRTYMVIWGFASDLYLHNLPVQTRLLKFVRVSMSNLKCCDRILCEMWVF